MNKNILNIEVQKFIKNYKADISKLAFSKSLFKQITVKELIQQIESRRKIENKLPAWFKKEGIYYPPKLNLEQTSSELSAMYKSSLLDGNSLADLTGGFGVDTYYLSKNFEAVTHFELNQSLSEIAQHNLKQLGQSNIQFFNEDGIKGISKANYDVIYVDPSRRHTTKGKVVFLSDCEPNIPDNLTMLLSKCDTLLIKTSPMLDISAGLRELDHVFQIHVVAIENEVKELLWVLRANFFGIPEIKTINISKKTSEIFSFQLNKVSQGEYGQPESFLYEPNAAILKSGAFALLSEEFNVKKLHKNTHLYTSAVLRNFPGRRFSIKRVVPYNKTSIKSDLIINKANVTIRNFPEDVKTLRKKWKIKDGGQEYLFFTSLENDKKVILVCTKID